MVSWTKPKNSRLKSIRNFFFFVFLCGKKFQTFSFQFQGFLYKLYYFVIKGRDFFAKSVFDIKNLFLKKKQQNPDQSHVFVNKVIWKNSITTK